MAQPGDPPPEPPPSFIILSKVDKERQTVSFAATVTVQVPLQVRVIVLENGVQKIVEKVQLVTETRVKETPIDLKAATFFNAKGEKITVKEALKKVRPGDAILLSGTNGMVDRRYAALLRDDALILVHPLGSALTVGRPPMPKAPVPPPPPPPPPPK